ncbi:hypothetical protein MIND_00484100 [Mycena indigotica]|uniref:GRAM domain-containing protein n=1 Tax=Mycena indigotica TaxID=2126181 RepID=A0A8H6W8H5_9AGAR|nr:uncharacterized protein MIND_00484100 [Mycena indigotica]KAF7306916.1 hypothetical protein MIND_00484100 [Mycena indigotica]
MQPHHDEPLSEQKLRELYDADEINRFLSFFSAHVSEVQVQDQEPSPTYQRHLDESSCISNIIATRYVIPRLPSTSPTPPLFTFGRLRLTTERLYLSFSAYQPFFASLLALARWDNRQTSAVFCTMYWALWYHNLLLPSIILRILWSLLRRRLLSYPTLSELNAHHEEIKRSSEFGREFAARFSATSSFGAREIWRLFRVFNKPKAKTAHTSIDEPPATVLDSESLEETDRENDMKQACLKTMADIADLHERVKNIFIWRQPTSSMFYGITLFVLFLLTLLVPAEYLAKLLYLVGGILYWHIVPVIAALPSQERSKLPPPFADAPTDADYAMELISRRVAAGLDVSPGPPVDDADKAHSTSSSDGRRSESARNVNWKKWAEIAAQGRNLVNERRRVTHALPSRSSAGAAPTHTFPAQHTSAPGLITLTVDRLYFTSLVSSNAALEIPLVSLRAVKKRRRHGLFDSLSLTWVDTVGVTHVEEFMWMGARDELFARLVGGVEGKRLITA